MVGAGVFGSWTAYHLQRSGIKVALINAYGPGNSLSSSGGESRVIRMAHGPDEFLTQWVMRALASWHDLAGVCRLPIFYPTGVLWMWRDDHPHALSTLQTFEKLGVTFERLDRGELERRYPQMAFGDVSWAIYEPQGGALMARRAVQAVADEAVKLGADYLHDSVAAPADRGRIALIATGSGKLVRAETYVFACGPWLPKIFPDLLRDKIFATRQEVVFFGTPAGDRRYSHPALPIWVDFVNKVYSLPNLEARGVKIASGRLGPPFDPDTGQRIATPEGIEAARSSLGRVFPELIDAPVIETRVCQYENSANGDLLIDRHPEMENVWIVGGGSGHGFKHGPALGEYLAAKIIKSENAEPRFTLSGREPSPAL